MILKIVLLLAVFLLIKPTFCQIQQDKLIYKKLINNQGNLFCEGLYRKDILYEGTKYIYDEYGLLQTVVKYSNGIPSNNAALISFEHNNLRNTYHSYIGINNNADFSISTYLKDNYINDSIEIPNLIDSNGLMQGAWVVSNNNKSIINCRMKNELLSISKKNIEFAKAYGIKIINKNLGDSAKNYLNFDRLECTVLSKLLFDDCLENVITSDTNKDYHSFGHYVNSLKHGPWVRFDSTGRIKTRVNYYLGILNGTYVTYHKNGKIKETSSYTGNHYVGAFASYYETGELQCLKSFDSKGRGNGSVIYFYPSGMVELIFNMIDGKESGPVLYLNNNGEIDSALTCLGANCTKIDIINHEVKAVYEFADAMNSSALFKDSLMKSEIDLQKLETKQQKTILESKTRRNLLIFSSLIALLGIVLFYVTFRSRKNVKKERDAANYERDLAEKRRQIIEEKNKEITDSINYAERIQRSFLAADELLQENLEDYFVYFNPKEAVSGDFYWAGQLSNGHFAIVNADSTGHGVPGAIMSILNVSSIEKAVENKATHPAEIFNQTRTTIIDRLKKDGSAEGGKDGMDASLIAFNKDKTKMVYVAAQNPIWIIRAGELTEIKPEKMPVGKHDKDHIPFTGGEYDIQKGDQIYTLTDGFQDQFGGPKGKKFMVKKMREYVLSISTLPMEEQLQKISETFTAWKGDVEQIDDVCVIGVRI